MALSSRAVAQLAVAALAVSLAACSSSTAKTASSKPPTASTTASLSSSSSAAPKTAGYASLLLDAKDIPVPGVVKGTAAAPPQGTGATVAFTAAGGRTLGDTVLVLPDSATAKTAAQSSVAAAKQNITNAVTSVAPIGGGGTALRGTSSSGSAVAVLIFSEGKALVVLQFESSATDPVPTAVVQQVATAQDSKIKAGLPA